MTNKMPPTENIEADVKKNRKLVKEAGWTIDRRGKWDKNCPYSESIYVDSGHNTWATRKAYRWQDHIYMLKKKNEKGETKTIYVTEPYHFEDESFADMHLLIEDGWSVEIQSSQDFSLHYPGQTIPIWITRED